MNAKGGISKYDFNYCKEVFGRAAPKHIFYGMETRGSVYV